VKVNPFFLSVIIWGGMLLLGLSPVLLHYMNPDFDISIGAGFLLLGYRESNVTAGLILGPYGMGAAVLSLFVPLSFGLGAGIYYKLRSKNIIEIRDETKKLEAAFASALFQLGNRLGDNLPAELAFGRVADLMQDTVAGNFFKLVSNNIKKLGMGVEDAIYNPRVGAIMLYPSKIIDSAMKVLVQSIKKGPQIAAQALMNISRYIKEIHKVNERLKDLMADIISSMKSQINFLTPVISGIVIGITSMITNIISNLGNQMRTIGSEAGTQTSNLAEFFGDGLPTYYFQIVVGIYVVQLVYILTVLSNGIENGEDKLNERFTLGTNLIRSTLLYALVALFVMVLFNFIASAIMGVTVGLGENA
jgi:hypothetical protein